MNYIFNEKSEYNKGFSLVELIVVIAIMVIMTGVLTLSVSLVIGAEAKQACEKISSQLNEVKTGSMARYGEDLNVVYVENPDDFEWADKEGYYAVKQMTTMGIDSTTKMPTAVAQGVEHRFLCNSRVTMVLSYGDADVDITPDDGAGFGISFDRATGMYENIMLGCSIVSDDDPKKDGTVSYTSTVKTAPKSLVMKSGLREYTISFDSETGKHKIER